MTTATAKRVNKLYEGLSPEALATLGIEAVLKDDESAIEKIKSIVPMKTYSQPVIEFESRITALHRVLDFVGFEYWRQTAYFLMSKSDDRLCIWEEQVNNLMRFLCRVCESTQLDFDLVLKYLHINEKYASAFKEFPADEELVSEWLEMLDL